MDWETRAASLILFLGILLASIQNGIAERRIVCYYTNWSVYRPGTAKFSPQNINPYLCTHLIYAFGGFTKDNALKPFDKYQDIEKGGYAKFTGLKTYNKNLKTMLAIGGWNEGSSRFSPMVADAARRREFVKNAIKFLRQNHFDGLDLDWEYPGFRNGGKPRDKDNYANLVQELREEFEREASKTGRSRLLLSMAMPAGIEYIDKGYDVPRLNDHLDFINLLSYDYHSAYEPAVNHHSPLYPLEEDNEYNYDAELTIDYTISHLLDKGASADKIILGIPTYGRSYTLFNQDATELGSPADGPGVEGEATREKGYLAYYEICESIAESDEWQVVEPNSNVMGPYAFKGDQWVGYDDENIVKLKARYVNEKKLGGIMFWSIDNDDFRGKCHGRPYPLIEAAKEALLTETRNTIDKTKSVDSRKKTRIQANQSDIVARKSSPSGRRSSTTSAPATKKRVSSSRPKYRTVTRSRTNDEEQEDREVSRRSYEPSADEDTEARNTVRATEKTERPRNRSRGKTRNGSTNHGSRKKQSRPRGQNKTDEDGESLSNKLTTPEPPTTPDPGTDFKCEDEGFFPHPRDCKKYFWCLDSGPGGLGVVAHQFTCPSGLVFNKGADSCDYPRNVICPKSKTSIASTTRSPITAATSRTTYLYSTTTAKVEELQDEYDEEEDYDEDENEESEEEEVREEPKIIMSAKPLVYKTLTRNRPTTTTTTTTTTSKPSEPERIINGEDEEDPKVIKELIDLIKKAGGIEQLERQLLLQERNSDTTSGSENVTPATISRSLYERVLNRQSNKINNQRSVFSSSETSYVNGPGRAQFEGLDDIPEVKSLRRSQKPQYVTIERPKSVTREPTDENIDENEEDDDNTEIAFSEEQSVANPLAAKSTQRVTPNYVNIRRSRPSTASRKENDVGGKEVETEETGPIRRRRPSLSSKQQDNETSNRLQNRGSTFSNAEREEDLENAEKDDSSTTAKSRYVSIQRFRSTTSKIFENSSAAVPASELTGKIASSPRAEEYPEATSTAAGTTAVPSVTATPTTSTSTEVITVISIEPPENLLGTVAAVGVTTDPTADSVKLVEDSATEILLTTVPVSSTSRSTTVASRTTVAAVSLPRPFGFTRRRSGLSEATTTTSNVSSSNQVKSKVSITSRNLTRSSNASLGRGRLRTRPTIGVRVAEDEAVDQTDGSRTEAPLRKNVSRTRNRSTNRYTPSTLKLRTEDASSANSVAPRRYRDRSKFFTTTSTTVSSIASGGFRKRYRRPNRTSSTESIKANELDDSPIIRITQGNSRRNLSSRSRAENNDEENSTKISRIKIFRKPPAVNRELYDRTRYTKKRNDDVEFEESVQKTDEESDRAQTLSTTSRYSRENVTVKVDEVEKGDLPNIVDRNGEVTSEETTVADSAIESNTVEPIYTVQPIVQNYDVTTVSSDRIDYTSERPDDVLATTTAQIKNHELNPDLITTERAVNTVEWISATPRRRKILLRKRPVSPTSTVANTVDAEEEQGSRVTRRRKVIKRVRPLQDIPTSTETSVEEEEAQENRSLLPDGLPSTTPMGDRENTEESTSNRTGITSELEDFTATVAETTLSADRNLVGFTKVTLETPVAESTIALDEDVTDTFGAVDASTINAIIEDQSNAMSASEMGAEVTTIESTLVTAALDSTETGVFPEEDTLTPATELGTWSVTRAQATTLPSTSDSSPTAKSSFELRYAHKKFIRKSPVLSARNATDRNSSASSAENSNLEVLSRRRNNLFIRRQPVSSTNSSDNLKYPEDEGVIKDDSTERKIVEDTTLRDNSGINEPASTNILLRDDIADFWRHYTPALETVFKTHSPERIEDVDDRILGRTGYTDQSVLRRTTITNRRPEIRPRYRVPVILKRPFDPEEALSPRRYHPLDSAPEESEDTPETKDARLRQSIFRQPRTRYKLLERGNVRIDETTKVTETTPTSNPESTTWHDFKTRSYSKRPPSSTEVTVTETLIPARKFDYAADAVHRKQQSLRTTTGNGLDSLFDTQNLVDSDYASTTTTAKPLITRLVTSVAESATTERQRILIKTKYSSLTSATRIPVDHFPSTSRPAFLVTASSDVDDNENVNDIRSAVERSTLSIEGEFSHRHGRFTTESHESSTIEIESVFSNLIADKANAQ